MAGARGALAAGAGAGAASCARARLANPIRLRLRHSPRRANRGEEDSEGTYIGDMVAVGVGTAAMADCAISGGGRAGAMGRPAGQHRGLARRALQLGRSIAWAARPDVWHAPFFNFFTGASQRRGVGPPGVFDRAGDRTGDRAGDGAGGALRPTKAKGHRGWPCYRTGHKALTDHFALVTGSSALPYVAADFSRPDASHCAHRLCQAFDESQGFGGAAKKEASPAVDPGRLKVRPRSDGHACGRARGSDEETNGTG